MRAPVYRGEGGGWWCGGVIPSHPLAAVPGVLLVYNPPPMYLGALPPATVLQHPEPVGAVWGAPGGKGEELQRACERVGEAERRLWEGEAQVMGVAAGAAGAQASTQGSPGGGGRGAAYRGAAARQGRL